MLSKLWQNSVMTSAIEFYCLSCECHLRSAHDAELHIAKPVHRKALDAMPYFDGHEEDRIRKVPSGYFCEYCNLLFHTSSKVGLHVSEANHRSTKGQSLLRRDGNNIVAFNNVSISDKAWNGFRGSTCVVCSKDYVFENIHKSDKEHVIKLIQSVIEFGEGNSIYRKIDDGYMQCLTCNEEFHQNNFRAHFDSPEHKNKYDESKIPIANTKIDEIEYNEKGKVESFSENSKKGNENPKNVNVRETEKLNNNGAKKNERKPEEVKKKKEEKSTVNKNKTMAKDKSIESLDPYELDKKFREVLNADSYVSDLDDKFCILCETQLKEDIVLHLKSIHHLRLLKLHNERMAKRMESGANTAANDSLESNISSEKKVPADNRETELNEANTKTNLEEANNKDRILESLSEFTKEGININFESLVATCKTCKKDVEFDYKFITDHIVEHKRPKNTSLDLNDYKDEAQNTKLFSEPVLMKKEASADVKDKEIIDYANKHGFELKDNVYLCGICGVSVTASFGNLKGHVTGKAHKNRVRKRSGSPERALAVVGHKMPMMHFIKTMTQIDNFGFADMVINSKYCINILSFFMYTRHSSNRLRCQVCRVNLSLHDLDLHKMEHEHQEKMQHTLVLTHLQDEFIREVQPKVLHCGYCNLAVNESDLDNHLRSSSHKEVKRSMMARLEQYLPDIRNMRRQEAGMEAIFVQIMLRAILNREFQ